MIVCYVTTSLVDCQPTLLTVRVCECVCVRWGLLDVQAYVCVVLPILCICTCTLTIFFHGRLKFENTACHQAYLCIYSSAFDPFSRAVIGW